MAVTGGPNRRLVAVGVQIGTDDVQYIRAELNGTLGSDNIVGATCQKNYNQTKGTFRRMGSEALPHPVQSVGE